MGLSDDDYGISLDSYFQSVYGRYCSQRIAPSELALRISSLSLQYPVSENFSAQIERYCDGVRLKISADPSQFPIFFEKLRLAKIPYRLISPTDSQH